MKILLIGTGNVGRTLAARLMETAHEVKMITRDPESTKERPIKNVGTFKDWMDGYSGLELIAYTEISETPDIIINATNGNQSLNALEMMPAKIMEGSVLLDLSNGLDTSKGMPPSLTVCNDDSLGEQIQRAFPKTYVVKSLNTMNCEIMLDPSKVDGAHDVFMSGNKADAKSKVKSLLNSTGWKNENIIDLGDISTARGTEMLLPVWLRLWQHFGHANFNFKIVK